MRWTIELLEGRVVFDDGEEWDTFTYAIDDCVTRRRPPGEAILAIDGWLDLVARVSDSPPQGTTGTMLGQGNISHLVWTPGGVEAEPHYELFAAQLMPTETFVETLRAMRTRISELIEQEPQLPTPD